MGDDDVTEDDGDLLCLPLSPTTILRWVDPSQWSENPLVAVVAVTMLVVVVLITPVILRCVWTLHSTTTNKPTPTTSAGCESATQTPLASSCDAQRWSSFWSA
jgi:hypothetical protein